jgi:hypothetical protein
MNKTTFQLFAVGMILSLTAVPSGSATPAMFVRQPRRGQWLGQNERGQWIAEVAKSAQLSHVSRQLIPGEEQPKWVRLRMWLSSFRVTTRGEYAGLNRERSESSDARTLPPAVTACSMPLFSAHPAAA